MMKNYLSKYNIIFDITIIFINFFLKNIIINNGYKKIEKTKTNDI